LLRLIAGSGRSGTTWVLDTLADANALRPIFEPLHPETSELAQRFAHAYLSRDSDSSELAEFFTAIANHGLRSVWTSYRIRPDRLRVTSRQFRSRAELQGIVRKWSELVGRVWRFRSRERRKDVLVKCIRANLMLDWIQANFEARIVLLMRHPCAVVESQLRLAEHWDPYDLLAKYRNDGALMAGPLNAQNRALQAEFSRPQALAAVWCIENLVPVAQAAANNYQVIFYEELLAQPDREWQRLAHALALHHVPDMSVLQKPSQQAAATWQRGGAAGEDYSSGYGKWRRGLTAQDLREIASTLEAFGVQFYSVGDDRPDLQAFSRVYNSI
jgi:hypothetical protein